MTALAAAPVDIVRVGLTNEHHSLVSGCPTAIQPYMSHKERKEFSNEISTTIGAKLATTRVQQQEQNKIFIRTKLPALLALYCGVMGSVWFLLRPPDDNDVNHDPSDWDTDMMLVFWVGLVLFVIITGCCRTTETTASYRQARTALARPVLRKYTQRFQHRPGQLVFTLEWSRGHRRHRSLWAENSNAPAEYTFYTDDGRLVSTDACLRIHVKHHDENQSHPASSTRQQEDPSESTRDITATTDRSVNDRYHYQAMV